MTHPAGWGKAGLGLRVSCRLLWTAWCPLLGAGGIVLGAEGISGPS